MALNTLTLANSDLSGSGSVPIDGITPGSTITLTSNPEGAFFFDGANLVYNLSSSYPRILHPVLLERLGQDQGQSILSVNVAGSFGPGPTQAGGVDAVARAAAAAANANATRGAGRILNMVVPIGDSRTDAVYLNASQLGYGARSPLNVAKALLGQRIIVGPGLGKSGDRTDQTLARMMGLLPTANASVPSGDPRSTKAKIGYVQVAVNNIAQTATGFTYVHSVTGETVTIGTVASVTFRDLRQIADMMIDAGMTVIMENEVGANGISTQEKVTAMMNLRQMIREYAESTPGIYLHDAFSIIANPTNSTSAIALRPTLIYDATHPNALGSYLWGKSLAALISGLVPASTRGPLLLENIAESQAANRRQVLLNPLFAANTGGTVGTGITGTVPANWGAACGGAATATTGTTANINGIGNDVTVAATFNGNADSVRFNQSLSGNSSGQYNAQLAVGDIIQAVAQIDVTGNPSGLASLYLSLVCNKGGGDATPTSSFDMFSANSASDYGVNEACTLTLATRPFAIPASIGSFPFLTAEIRAVARASGSANFTIRQFGVMRRDSTY